MKTIKKNAKFYKINTKLVISQRLVFRSVLSKLCLIKLLKWISIHVLKEKVVIITLFSS